MQNRNYIKNLQERRDLKGGQGLNNIQAKACRSYNFIEDQLNQNFLSDLPSPISKKKFDLSSNTSKDDIFNYSSNRSVQEPNPYNYRSYPQSPENQDKHEKNNNLISIKKHSNARQSGDIGQLNENSWQSKLKIKQTNQISNAFKKQNENKSKYREQNQEQGHKFQWDQPERYHSQKCIENHIPQKFRSQSQSQKYQALAKSYQQIQRQLQKMREQNLRLKRSKQQLMNQNLSVNREARGQIQSLSNQIQALKQQLYIKQMQQTSINTTMKASNNQRTNLGTTTSPRGYSQHNPPTNNQFYIEQLQRQNDQLIRDNRRLNSIVMKRLKHSIAE